MSLINRMNLEIDKKGIEDAARVLKNGGQVAFPTETVYGLGANALDPDAVAGIFKIKGRPADNPLIVHVGCESDVEKLVKEIPEIARELMRKFWPGPLTLVLPKSDQVPEKVTAGLNTVAIRMPSHPIALELIRSAGVPVAAPSANLSGKPSPTRARDVIEDLNGKVEYIIDGGDCEIGVESTVLDLTTKVPTILRPGGVTKEELEQVLGEVSVHKGKQEKPASPGMKYRHYSPRAKLILVEGKKVRGKIEKIVNEYSKRKKVGVLSIGDFQINADCVMNLGENDKQVSKNLFAYLREMDRKKVDVIIVEGLNERGRGLAVMNRLRKAASEKIKVE